MSAAKIAARCQAARVADEELDIVIWRNVFGRSEPDVPASPPGYTSSITAAATLVPDGFDWTIYAGADGQSQAGCALADPEGVCVAEHSDSYGETPALALCAAAMRVRA